MTIYREITRREEIEIPIEQIRAICECSIPNYYILLFKDVPNSCNCMITEDEYRALLIELKCGGLIKRGE